jgi:proline iminopeptidase
MIFKSIVRALAGAALVALAARPAAAAHRSPVAGIEEEHGLVGVARAQLHYRLWRREERLLRPGPPRPLLVYMHGGPGANGTVFRHAVGALLVRRVGDLLFIDQRGAGRSPVAGLDPADFTLERFADDARRVLEWVRAQHPELPAPAVIGHSFGAGIAVLLARGRPGLVSRLVLLSPALDYRDLKYHAYLSMKHRAREVGDAAHLDRIRELEVLHPPGSESEAQLFAAALTGARFDFGARRFAGAEESDLHRILSGRDGEPLRVAEHWRWFVDSDRIDRKDLTPELTGLQLPVLVLGGREDYLTPPACLEKIQALTPGARRVMIDGAGHHPYLLAPEEFVRVVGDFVR